MRAKFKHIGAHTMGSEFTSAINTFLLSVLDFTRMFFESLPFTTATWFVIGILVFSGWIFFKASKNPRSPVRWEHMIIDSVTDRTSPYKLGYLIGVIVSTWVVITILDAGKLGLDILGAYLTFLVGGAGFTEWLKHGKVVTEPQPTNSDDVPIDDFNEELDETAPTRDIRKPKVTRRVKG